VSVLPLINPQPSFTLTNLTCPNLDPRPPTPDLACEDNFLGATLNGTTRTAYFDDEFATGKIRVTSLNLDASEAPGSKLCFRMKLAPTCNTFATLCEQGDGSCK
jgi:hypothetical protein